MEMIKHPQPIYTQQLYVNEIVLANDEEIHLLGFSKQAGQFVPVNVIGNYDQLYELLYQSGKVGNEIALRIDVTLSAPHAAPLSIDLVDLFGLTQILACRSMVLEPADEQPLITSVHNRPETLFVQHIETTAGPAIH